MHRDDHSEQPAGDRVSLDARPPCVALVPVAETAQWSHIRPLPRPDSIFLTHLIATSEQAPQTRHLRRASASDANAAYTANRLRFTGPGLRARQIV
jgi:hypothetical protein